MLASLLLFLATGMAGALQAAPVPVAAGHVAAFSEPATFLANGGRFPDSAAFHVRRRGLDLWCEPQGFLLDLHGPARDAEPGRRRGVALAVAFVGARDALAPHGQERRGGRRSLVRGREPSAWVGDVPAYASVRWTDAWDGVDVLLRGDGDALAWDVLLAPGADPGAVLLSAEGAERVRIDAGALLLDTPLGVLAMSAPVAWQLDAGGRRVPVASAWALRGEARFGFELGPYDAARPLVIDPSLEWGGFLGGGGLDHAHALAVAADGSVTAVGYTVGPSYPTTTGAYDTSANGLRDGFVTRVAADGTTLLSSTLLGGAGDDEILAVAALPGGGVALTGWTASADFPQAGQTWGRGHAGGGSLLGSDAFVACLQGGDLLLGALLGGAGDDIGYGVAVGADGALSVVGKTASVDFPVTAGAFDTTWGGGTAAVGDAFAVRLAPGGGEVAWATFVGGAGDDLANDLVLGADGSLTLAGWTSSADFPTTAGAVDRSLAGSSDGFVATLAHDGATLLAATYLGGGSDENLLALARTPGGALVAAGSTRSPDLAVSGALQAGYGGGFFYGDGLLARLSPDLSQLERLTYLGGAGDDLLTSVAALPGGQVVVGGFTASADMPLTPDALDATKGGAGDGWVALVDLQDGTLEHATFVGGAGHDRVNAVAVAGSGQVLVAGTTSSADFPATVGSWDPTYGGGAGLSDAFVASLDLGLLPPASTGWIDLGQGLAGLHGVPSLSASGGLLPGGSGVLLLSQAREHALAMLVIGSGAAAVPLAGGTLVPFPLLALPAFGTDGGGALALPYQLPPALPSGLQLAVQAWVLDAAAPQHWSASNALLATSP